MDSKRALLLIADMSGYTEYMRTHRMSLGHAEAITARLLEKVIDAARDFDLIEIEGDAAFLSRPADGLDSDATIAATTQAVVSMHGTLVTPQPAKRGDIKAAVLAVHGAADPIAPKAERVRRSTTTLVER